MLKLGSTCPNCKASLWKLQHINGIDFCPYCDTQLISVADIPKPVSRIKRVLPHFIALIVFILFLNFYTDPIVGNILRLFGYVLLPVMILVVVFGIFYEVLKKRVAHGTYMAGIDKIETVTDDPAVYFKTSLPNAKIVNFQCPECSSQRMVDLYWYKRILAKQMTTLPKIGNIDNTDDFVGCLNCHIQYKKQRNFDIKGFKVASVFLGIALLALIFNSHFVHLVSVIDAMLEKTGQPKVAIIWLCFLSLNLVLAFFFPKKHINEQQTSEVLKKIE